MQEIQRAARTIGALLLATAPVHAQGPAPQAAAPLERALETVSPDGIRADVTFLAADEMRGRNSPSPELKIAARYIRARLMRLGFQPGDRDGDFLYRYSWPQSGIDVDKMGASLVTKDGSRKLTWAEDYFVARGAFGKRSVSGPIVWGGDLSDLDVADAKGHWILASVEDRVPSRRSLGSLEEAGALGVLLLPFGDDVEAAYERLAEDNERRIGPFLSRPGRGGRGGRSAPTEDAAGFPMLHLSPGVAASFEALASGRPRVGKELPGTFSETCAYGRLEDAELENVCGFWPGNDPELKDEVILISAHYDHVGVGGGGEVFNGADDNASGTSGMLALAQALHAYGPMRRSVMLIWVSAEEKGLYGSQAWTEDPSMPEGTRPLCNINIDMIGRNASNELLITPTREHPNYSLLTKAAEKHAEAEGFTKLGSADAYWRRSDHKNFADNLEIPVAFLFTDIHEDYHKQTDTPDRIDYDKAHRVVRLVVRMLHDLQVDEPAF